MPDTNASAPTEVGTRSPESPHWEFVGPHKEAMGVGFSEIAFEGVVMRVFPLRANLLRLRRFCDRYLNMDVPREIAHFEPAYPYVFMMVINYGRMADAASNMGWVSQNEILFGVPLIGSWNEGGKTIRGQATVSPFIFVDNEWSISTGREVYGWPKMKVWLEPGLNPWLRDPRAPRRLMTLRTMAMTEFYKGQEAEARTLVEIEQRPAHVFGQVPLNLEYLMNPLIRLPKTVAETLAATPDFLKSLTGMFKLASGSDLPQVISNIFKSLTDGSGPGLSGNTINLKQFRSSDPGTICYQSLVNSRMEMERYNAGGLMGSVEFLRGDPTGGFSIYVHQLPAFQIVETLGIEVARTHNRQGIRVAELEPLLPFWASLDISYQRGERICWRSYGRPWRAWGVGDPASEAGDSAKPLEEPAPFNTTLGGVVATTQGPFDFYDASIRVLPILARSTALSEILPKPGDLEFRVQIASFRSWERSINEIVGEEVEPTDPDPFDALVFLVVTSYGEMSSAMNDIGWWAKNEVALLVPVEDGETTWMAWPYVFSDSAVAVNEGREVLGLPTSFARILPGEDPWLGLEDPGCDRRLLTLSVMDYPAAGVGQQAIEQSILAINRSDATHGALGSGKVERFKDSRSFDRYRTEGICIPNMAIKEFRDEELPHRPCYQAMVGFDRELGRWTEEEGGYGAADKLRLESLPGRYSVTFKSTPSWPIVEKLGLKHRSVRSHSDAPVAVCDVIEPFWIRANIRAHLSKDLIHRRIDTPDWTKVALSQGEEPVAASASRRGHDPYLNAELGDSGMSLEAEEYAEKQGPPRLRDLIRDIYKA